MKKSFSAFILLLFLFNLSFANAAEDSCKNKAEIDQCVDAVKKFNAKDKGKITPGGSLREFTDFPCLQAPTEENIFQINMHKNFESIDKEMDEYLGKLSDEKDTFFGTGSGKTYLDGLDEINSKSNGFLKAFKEACSKTVVDSMGCMMNYGVVNSGGGEGEVTGKISVNLAKDFLANSDGTCYSLGKLKVEIFKQVSYDVLLLNKQQVMRDEKKLYDQEIRSKYSIIVDLMAINLGYVERIWKKIVTFIKNTL